MPQQPSSPDFLLLWQDKCMWISVFMQYDISQHLSLNHNQHPYRDIAAERLASSFAIYHLPVSST